MCCVLLCGCTSDEKLKIEPDCVDDGTGVGKRGRKGVFNIVAIQVTKNMTNCPKVVLLMMEVT